MIHTRNLLPAIFLLGMLPATGAAADIPVKGGCLLGESMRVHGLAPEAAQARIKQYAQLYLQANRTWGRQKTDTRRRANAYMELDEWTQQDVVGFTREQRELLYIAVGGELATGKLSAGEVPGYVVAIDNRIQEIEVELGCELLPGDPG